MKLQHARSRTLSLILCLVSSRKHLRCAAIQLALARRAKRSEHCRETTHDSTAVHMML
jgi:hypothetical protein